jgi:D-alanyl-D-alanine-carboxypeptidase/D-alanyl-D-alanine-endopeptidase
MKKILPRALALGAALSAAAIAVASEAPANDKLLDEVLQSTGEAFFLETKAPALVIGAIRNGESWVTG